MRTKAAQYIEYGVLAAGGIMVNAALIYGVGVRFGWWSLLFWAGVGVLLGSVRRR